MKNKRMRIIFAIVLFLAALYLAEFSAFSSRAVEMINGGYGTFDMKSYDAKAFLQVMEATTDMAPYWKYYICDFLFVAAFLNLMIQLAHAFDGKLAKRLRPISYGLAIIRACLDIIENCILLSQIYSYPDYSQGLIETCNIITTVKFASMFCWVICFIIMLISQSLIKQVDRLK